MKTATKDIIASETQKGTSVIALLPFTKDGKTVVAPVYIDGFGIQNTVKIDSNAVTSIYGRKNAVSNLLTKALNDHKSTEPHVFYLDKAKATALYQGSKVTVPKMPNTSDGFVSSIRDVNSPVKLKIKDVTESRQFKRWFGNSKSALDAKLEAGQNQNRKYSREYSGKNVEWAVNNDIITENERAAFFHKVADVRKLGHKYRQTASGDYILEIGNKLLFTDANWKSPSLNMVVSFSDNSENSMLYAKEIILNEAKSEADYNRARQIIEDTYWPGYVEFDYSRNYKSDVGQATGRKGSHSKANNEEPISYSREPESITELRRQNERLLAQATNEDAANENERGLIKDYKRQYDKVSGIAEKLDAARQAVNFANANLIVDRIA